jgi:tetratricopeptide (TPR) repeat protein
LQGYLNWALALSMLELSYVDCYKDTGGMGALAQLVELFRKALASRPRGHRDRSASMSNLATTMFMRYKQTCDINDWSKAILLYHEALSLLSQGYHLHASIIDNLALLLHHHQAGSMDELAETINMYRKALEICPKGHSQQVTLRTT